MDGKPLSLDDAVQEMITLLKALPPRPSVPEVDIACATISEVDKSLAEQQAQLLLQPTPFDVPPLVFTALQEMRKEALIAKAAEQKRSAEAVLELENRYITYDKWIQQANSAISGTGPSRKEGEANNGSSGDSARSVLDADWDCRLSTASNTPPVIPSSRDTLSMQANGLPNQDPSSNIKPSCTSRSLSWSSEEQPRVRSTGEKFSKDSGGICKAGPKTTKEMPQVEGKDSGSCLSLLSMLDTDQRSSSVLNLQGSYGKEMEKVSDSVFLMTGLTHLNLSQNKLSYLPDSIGNLCNLVHLNLSMNRLLELPESIGNLACLKILNIDHNRIEELPVAIGQCTALVELTAGFNVLKALPQATGQLTNLQCLHVYYNKLTSLPTTMASLTSLTELDVHFNEIQAIPEGLCYISTLTRLNLASNFAELKELPQKIGQLQKLKSLNLSYNQITVLPGSFAMLTNLQDLDLSGNPLRVPPQNVTEQGIEAVLNYMAEYVAGKEKGKEVAVTKKGCMCSLLFACLKPCAMDDDVILA